EIARELNERKILNEFGRPWRMLAIRRHLEDEKYLGNYVYNRKSGKLKTPRTPNPENTWVRCNGAFEAIIDPAIFAEAGKIIVGRGGPCAPGSPTAGCWRCSRRGYIQILTIPIQFRIRMADGAWRFCVRRSNVMERQRLLGHPYEEGFDPLADAHRNYSYGTRIWQISCSILRDTIWVVIPRYQAPFIMS
ncbi:MAG TPA: recombinase family protein, partial [Bradyrhizobium sp.]|nr:recombinase family protein [Bradyrhizobium sp.]